MEQLNIFEVVIKKEKAAEIYLNALGYPLPWEEAYNLLSVEEKKKLLKTVPDQLKIGS